MRALQSTLGAPHNMATDPDPQRTPQLKPAWIVLLVMMAIVLAGPLILLFYVSVPVAVIGSVWCGILALRSIERSPAKVHGRWAAILCCLAYPMLLANVALYLCLVMTYPVSIYLVNGIKLQGQIESFDQFVVLLKNTVSQMVYKHAISTVVPSRVVRMPMQNPPEEDSGGN